MLKMDVVVVVVGHFFMVTKNAKFVRKYVRKIVEILHIQMNTKFLQNMIYVIHQKGWNQLKK